MRIGAGQDAALVDRMLETASSGRSSVVLVEGEPGIGKTALLDHAAECAADWVVLRARGAPSETSLAFSGLRDLTLPVASRIGDCHGRRRALCVRCWRSRAPRCSIALPLRQRP